MMLLTLVVLLSQTEPTAPAELPAPEATVPPPAPARPGVWPRPARDTAEVGPKGRWSTGIFNPTRYAFTDGFELEANPLLFFVAPNVTARFAVVQRPVHFTLEMGLLLPTFGMRLMKGYFFPSWETSSNDVGWMLVPRVGALLSGKVRQHDMWTVRADFSGRLPFGPNSATPIESFVIPLDLLLAAPLTGYLSRLGGAYDLALGERVRLRGELNFYLAGPTPHLYVGGVDVGRLAPRQQFTVTAHAGIDIAVFKHSRVTLGVLWANADQGATAVVRGADGFAERVHVRSNNFLPTLDYIWAGGFGD